MIDTKMVSSSQDFLKSKIKSLPASPGVYLMRDKHKNIIYAGKASNLRSRVGSYFSSSTKLSLKTQKMVEVISDIDVLITSSEEEAIVLELNLIKQYRPYFNINLKDDKYLPYLKIDANSQWPKLEITRRLDTDGATYFGPFGSSHSIRKTINTIKKTFPLRSCNYLKPGTRKRPCLEYDLGYCMGPCAGMVSQPEYNRVVYNLILFFQGHYQDIIKNLNRDMKQASKALNYELAARIRDNIRYIEEMATYQNLPTRISGDQDVIAMARDGKNAFMQLFLIRNGRLTGREGFFLYNIHLENNSGIMSDFVKQFYNSAAVIPPCILTEYPLDDRVAILEWLKYKKGGSVRVLTPSKGRKREIINLAAQNANLNIKSSKFRFQTKDINTNEALSMLKSALGLTRSPERIEGYDISNLQGKDATGSMVVFEKGKPQKSLYRRFKIRTVEFPDDYSMLKEIINRRFKRNKEKGNTNWGRVPDLLVIDGGKGQLNAAIDAIKETGLEEDFSIISIAKEDESIFIPSSKQPVRLEPSSIALHLLQQVRDESHRFALGHHRSLRNKSNTLSALDKVPGIGPRRKRELLTRFGSIKQIKLADIDELSKIKGVTREKAKELKGLI